MGKKLKRVEFLHKYAEGKVTLNRKAILRAKCNELACTIALDQHYIVCELSGMYFIDEIVSSLNSTLMYYKLDNIVHLSGTRYKCQSKTINFILSQDIEKFVRNKIYVHLVI